MPTVPASFTATYGKHVVIGSNESFTETRDDQISWHLLMEARNATNLALAKSGHENIRVAAAYLPALEPRVFTYWVEREPLDYVIAIKRGTAEVVRRALLKANFRSLLPPTSFVLRALHSDDLTDLAVTLTIGTLLFHDVAHITRFHFPYWAERLAQDPGSRPEVESQCEADADKWASYLIAPELLNHAKGIYKALRLNGPIEGVLREVLTLYGISLHIWYAFFNQTHFTQSSIYPHPLIRSTRTAIGAADNIPDDSAIDNQPIARALAVLQGLSAVEQAIVLDSSGNQHPFDLAEEMWAINSKFSEIESQLDPALRRIASRWKESN